jgi:hypothetical protein
MGRFTPRYTDRQRQAVVAAALDIKPRRLCPAIVKAAAAGTLDDAMGALEPFQMPQSTARALVRAEKARRRRIELGPSSSKEIGELLEHGQRVLMATWVRALDAQSGAVKPDVEQLRALAVAAKAIGQITGADKAKPAAKDAPASKPAPLSFIEQLARDHGDEPVQATPPHLNSERPS